MKSSQAPCADKEWACNPFNLCITHHGECSTCCAYAQHFDNTAMDSERSFAQAIDKRKSLSEAPFHDQLADLRDESLHHRARTVDASSKLSRMQEVLDEMQHELDEAKRELDNICRANNSINVPEPSVQEHPLPTPTGYQPGVFTNTIVRARAPPVSSNKIWPSLPPAGRGHRCGRGRGGTPHPASLIGQ